MRLDTRQIIYEIEKVLREHKLSDTYDVARDILFHVEGFLEHKLEREYESGWGDGYDEGKRDNDY